MHFYKHLLECDVAPAMENMTKINQLLCGNTNLLGSASSSENIIENDVGVNGNVILISDEGASLSASVHLSPYC